MRSGAAHTRRGSCVRCQAWVGGQGAGLSELWGTGWREGRVGGDGTRDPGVEEGDFKRALRVG